MIEIPIPANHQDFEISCLVLWKCILKDPNVVLHGRNGQAQYGVDIYGYRDKNINNLVGIQCKLKSSGGKLTDKEIKDEVMKALEFRPSLSEYFIVTTAKDSVATQQFARELSIDLANAGNNILIYIWGWNTLQLQINSYEDARLAFYSTLRKTSDAIDSLKSDLITVITRGNEELARTIQDMIEESAGRTGIPLSSLQNIIRKSNYPCRTKEQALRSVSTILSQIENLKKYEVMSSDDVGKTKDESLAYHALMEGNVEGYMNKLQDILEIKKIDHQKNIEDQFSILWKLAKAASINADYDSSIDFLQKAVDLYSSASDLPSNLFIAKWNIMQEKYLKAAQSNDKLLFANCIKSIDDLASDVHVKALNFLKMRLLGNKYMTNFQIMRRTYEYDNFFENFINLNDAWKYHADAFAEDIYRVRELIFQGRLFIGKATNDSEIIYWSLGVANTILDSMHLSDPPTSAEISRNLIAKSIVAMVRALLACMNTAYFSEYAQSACEMMDDILSILSEYAIDDTILASQIQPDALVAVCDAVSQVTVMKNCAIYLDIYIPMYEKFVEMGTDREFAASLIELEGAISLLKLRNWPMWGKAHDVYQVEFLLDKYKSSLDFEDPVKLCQVYELCGDCYAYHSLIYFSDYYREAEMYYLKSLQVIRPVDDAAHIFAQRMTRSARNKALTLDPRYYLKSG